jgi:hypothetical protein
VLVDVLPHTRHDTSEGREHGPDTEVLAIALEGFLIGRAAMDGGPERDLCRPPF